MIPAWPSLQGVSKRLASGQASSNQTAPLQAKPFLLGRRKRGPLRRPPPLSARLLLVAQRLTLDRQPRGLLKPERQLAGLARFEGLERPRPLVGLVVGVRPLLLRGEEQLDAVGEDAHVPDVDHRRGGPQQALLLRLARPPPRGGQGRRE
jgi:hypothetical protein